MRTTVRWPAARAAAKTEVSRRAAEALARGVGVDGQHRDVDRVVLPAAGGGEPDRRSVALGHARERGIEPVRIEFAMDPHVHRRGLVRAVARERCSAMACRAGPSASGRSSRRPASSAVTGSLTSRCMRQKLRAGAQPSAVSSAFALSPRSPTAWRRNGAPRSWPRCLAQFSSAVPAPSPSRCGIDADHQVEGAELGVADGRAVVVLDHHRVAVQVEAGALPLVVQVGEAVVGLADLGDVDRDHELRRSLRVRGRGRPDAHQAEMSRRRISASPAIRKTRQ